MPWQSAADQTEKKQLSATVKHEVVFVRRRPEQSSSRDNALHAQRARKGEEGWCWRPPDHAEAGCTKDHTKREGTRSLHKAYGESTQHKVENNVKDDQIQNNVKDGQREAKVQNDVMGGLEALGKKASQTRAVPAGSRQCLTQDSGGMDGLKENKTAGDGTQGPMKKRADLQLAKKSIANSRQELAKTGCGRKTASRRMARATRTCNDAYQVENKVKSLTAEALRGVKFLAGNIPVIKSPLSFFF